MNDIDDAILTIDQLIQVLQGCPDKSLKVWCSVEAGCVREGITGIAGIRDEGLFLNTTGT